MWRSVVPLSARVLPLLGLVGALFALLAPWGANTMDGGLILAQSYRVLHGEIPHLDFLTPRPAGSAYFHLLDFALPLPLVLASRLVAICEFVGYALLFGLIVYRRRISELSSAELAGVCCAALVSIQTFLIIPFYTIDGLVMLGAGWLLVLRAPTLQSGSLRLGFLFLGLATTTKQSFWFAPILAIAGLAFARRSAGKIVLLVESARLLAISVAPGLLYAVWVSAHGGLHDMLSQVFGAQTVSGSTLFDPFSAELALTTALLAFLAAVLVGVRLAQSVHARSSELCLRGGAVGVIVWCALRTQFSGQQWSRQLFWVAVLMFVWRSAGARRPDAAGAILLASAWMVSLSWGAPTPALIAGPLALYAADAAWRPGSEGHWFSPRLLSFVAAAAAIAVVGGVFWSVRVSGREDDQSVSLAHVAPALRGIHASRNTATLFRDARFCAARYPARYTAVIGEGALLSPTLGFRSPFPIDWFWLDDYRGHQQWLLDRTTALDARGHYLVLFQTAPQGLEARAEPGKIGAFFSDSGMASAIAERLHGEQLPCRTLVAVYRPGA